MTTITTRVVSVEAYDAMKAQRDALAARLAEAERFIAEIRAESAEDYRLPSYVVVQMSTATWDKLRASDSASESPEAQIKKGMACAHAKIEPAEKWQQCPDCKSMIWRDMPPETV